MSQKTQAELTALKVQDLKNILQEQGLPVNGVKADLVARILASQQSGSTNDASAAANTNAAAAGDAATTSAPSAKAAEQSEPSGTTAGESSTAAAVPALPEATSKETEAERRAKRAARFGDASGNDDEAAKKARQERFGTAGDAVDDKHVKALDSELSNKRIRTNEDGASAKPNQKKGGDKQHKQQQHQKGGQKPRSDEVRTISKPADAEEEERRRKRAERFGAKA